jgi:hypothetical protein
VPAEPLHDRVEVPEVPSVTLVGVSVQLKPVEGDTDGARVTVPVNELIEVTVIVEVPAMPAIAGTEVGLAVTEKSGTATL